MESHLRWMGKIFLNFVFLNFTIEVIILYNPLARKECRKAKTHVDNPRELIRNEIDNEIGIAKFSPCAIP